MRPAALACAAALALLTSCQTPERTPTDQTDLDPHYGEPPVVDVAVLRPTATGPDRERLARVFEQALRGYLIQSRTYAVPTADFVAKAVAHRDLAPAGVIEATGSDAVLTLRLDQWETDELLPKGRVYAGGEIALHGPAGALWRRTFHDRMTLSRTATVTASNRVDVLDQIVTDLVADLMSTLPSKVVR